MLPVRVTRKTAGAPPRLSVADVVATTLTVATGSGVRSYTSTSATPEVLPTPLTCTE